MGAAYALAALFFVAMAVAWMNYGQIAKQQKLVLITSTALTITAFCGISFGQGHQFAPAAVGIVTAALLAWKQPISTFAVGLSETELRSAILLAILSIVVLPVLPDRPVDSWRLVDLRETWGSVVLMAGIGFVNGTAVEIPVTVTATLPGQGDNGTDAVAKKGNTATINLSPVTWPVAYGPHGALASDWRWSYKWDSEGRLAGMETVAAALATVPNLRLKFAYDSEGHRIGKTVQTSPPAVAPPPAPSPPGSSTMAGNSSPRTLMTPSKATRSRPTPGASTPVTPSALKASSAVSSPSIPVARPTCPSTMGITTS